MSSSNSFRMKNLVKHDSLDNIITKISNYKDVMKLMAGRNCDKSRSINSSSFDFHKELDTILENLLTAYEYITPAFEELIHNASKIVLPKLTNRDLDETVWSVSVEKFNELVKGLLLIKEVNKYRILQCQTKLAKFPIDSFICGIKRSIRYVSVSTGTFKMCIKKDAVTQLTLLYKLLYDATRKIHQLSNHTKTDEGKCLEKENSFSHCPEVQNNIASKSTTLIRLEAEHRALCDAIKIFKSLMHEAGDIDSKKSTASKCFPRKLNYSSSLSSLTKVNQCVTDASGARRCILECLCELTEDSRMITCPISKQYYNRFIDKMGTTLLSETGMGFMRYKSKNSTTMMKKSVEDNKLLDNRFYRHHDKFLTSKSVVEEKNLKSNSMLFPACSSDLNYYIYLNGGCYQNNTIFEVRYFGIEYESPSKEMSHVKSTTPENEKHVANSRTTQNFEINTDAIEIRVFEFKRKNLSGAKEILEKLQSKLDSQSCDHRSNKTCKNIITQTSTPDFLYTFPDQHAKHPTNTKFVNHNLSPHQTYVYLQPCGVNTVLTLPTKFNTTTESSVEIPSKHLDRLKFKFTRTKPRSAPATKLRNQSHSLCQRFQGLFRDSIPLSSKINSSANLNESCFYAENPKTCTEVVNIKSTNKHLNDYDGDEIYKRNYDQFRCRGGFEKLKKKCVSNDVLSTTNTSVQCDILELNKKHTEKLQKTPWFDHFNTRKYEKNDLNSLSHVSEKPYSSEMLALESSNELQVPYPFKWHKELNRRSSPLYNPLVLSNKIESNIFEKFYCPKYVKDHVEQNEELELSYKMQSLPSSCETFSKEKYKFPEKDVSNSDYTPHSSFVLEDEFPTNILPESQSSLSNINESVTESSGDQYERFNDNVAGTSNPRIFKVDNYEDRNVYYIKDNECHAEKKYAWTRDNKKEQNKTNLRDNFGQSRYSIVVSSLIDAEASTDNHDVQICNEKVLSRDEKSRHRKSDENYTKKSNCDKSTQLPPITYRSKSLLPEN